MKKAALLFLWIVHISALVGIAAGYKDFFLPKSPFTLLYLLIIVVAFYPLRSYKTFGFFFLCFATGMIVEWIGVHTGALFGSYYYGDNMGPKIDGIPLLIGVNWGVLTLVTHSIAQKFCRNKLIVPLLGAALMTLLDVLLEQVCDYAGFWHFTGGAAGWYNYMCWFIIAALLHLTALRLKIQGNFTVSIHIYIVQLIFTLVLWLLITI